MCQKPTSHDPRDNLRKALRKARSNLSTEQVNAASLNICEKAGTLLKSINAQHVAAYYAFGNEVDLSALMQRFNADNTNSYVPIVLPEFKMLFAPVDNNTPITLNRYGIKEPQVSSCDYVDASSLDAVLVPLVGFDSQCNRMGMGGGYYDRCFAHRQNTKAKPTLIGVAFDLQAADTVYAQPWDVPLDYIITEKRFVQRKNNE